MQHWFLYLLFGIITAVVVNQHVQLLNIYSHETKVMNWYNISTRNDRVIMDFPDDNDEYSGLWWFFSFADDEDVIREIDECLADILSGKKCKASTGIQCEHPIYIYPDRVDVEYFHYHDDCKRTHSILPLVQFIEFYGAWKSALVELKRNRATPVD